MPRTSNSCRTRASTRAATSTSCCAIRRWPATSAAMTAMDELGSQESTLCLSAPMNDGELRILPLEETHRTPLKQACAEDDEIWEIYATSYDPNHFDASFELLR